MNVETIKHFSRAIQCGSKYIYQTVPRVLTLWLDMGEDPEANTKDLDVANYEVSKLIKTAPIYKVCSFERGIGEGNSCPMTVVYSVPSNRLTSRSWK